MWRLAEGVTIGATSSLVLDQARRSVDVLRVGHEVEIGADTYPKVYDDADLLLKAGVSTAPRSTNVFEIVGRAVSAQPSWKSKSPSWSTLALH